MFKGENVVLYHSTFNYGIELCIYEYLEGLSFSIL